MSKSGKWFEDKSRAVVTDYFPKDTLVHGEKKIKTTYNGFRKVDIGINKPGSFDYIIFECKDLKNGAGPGEVGYALDIMQDVGAHKAALLLNCQLSDNGIKKARARNLEVFNIINPKEKRLRPKLKVKTLSHFSWISKYKYALLFGDKEHDIYDDPEKVFLKDSETIKSLLKKLWNTGQLKQNTGIYSYTLDQFFMVKAPKLGVKLAAADGIRIDYEVIKKSYLYEAELNRGEGLFDVLKNEFIPTSRDISFGPLTIEDITIKGKEIKNSEVVDGLAFEGGLTYVIP